MTDNRKLELMQESLDETLSQEALRELNESLQQDPEEADLYARLERAEMVLRSVRHERAPERLALKIMARLGETVMLEVAQEEKSEITEATMQIAMTMVTVATLPLMVGVSWMLLNAQARPEAVEAILVEVAALLIMMIDVMTIMIDEAQTMFQTNPELAMALLALMPITLLTLVKQILGIEEIEDDEDEGDDA